MNYSLRTRVISMALAVIMAIGLVPINVFATGTEETTAPTTVTVTFDVNGGVGEYEDQVVTVGDKVAKPEQDPTRDTAVFAYWTADLETNEEWDFEEDVVTAAMTLYAAWEATGKEPEVTEPEVTEPEVTEPEVTEPATATYTVEHYLQTADGYELDAAATETLTAEIGAATKAQAKIYEGYTVVPFEQGVVAEDGSTVVKIMYNTDPVAADIAGQGLAALGMTVVTDVPSTLAPGVTMNEIVLYDVKGQRVEMQLTTSDPSVGTVHYYANFKDNDITQKGNGLFQTLSDQVAAIEANYEEPFKVVAGLNASYYNVSTNAPTGAFVMEGVDMSSSGDSYAFFAVLKDGTVMIGAKGDYSKYRDQIKEAIGGYIHIVKDGAVVSGLDKVTKYPRQTIGMTADGKVITMTADGSQAPQTIGLTVQEQAEVMLALGCVEALHLDGGNSATFGAVREGTDKFTTVNSPSGGAERAVSNTLMIVSTAVPDGAFDHAVITGDYDYFVPHTSYTFGAFGVDATSAAAEIPETAVWTLSDDSFGTIGEDGTFNSTGKLGKVDIQLSDNGKVIGSKSIAIVMPTAIRFAGEETTVPYGKSAALTVTAMYGNNEAFCTGDSFNWTVDPAEAGTINGFEFTAADESSISNATVTATYKHSEEVIPASVRVKFGKGSEVLFDFENGDISDWYGVETISPWIDAFNEAHPDAKYPLYHPKDYGNSTFPHTSDVFLATAENGKVKSGDYALGVRLDRLYADGVGSWIYNYLFYTGDTQIWRDVANGKNGVRIGMWVNMPQNATNTAFRICRTFTKDSTGKLYSNYDYMNSAYDGKRVSYNTDYAIPESGWIYVYFDLTAYDFQSSLQFSETESYAINNGKGVDGDYYPALIQFINGDKNDTMDETIIYIDDITLDYSDVTEDRDAPVITNVVVSSDGSNDVPLNGQTVDNNVLSFGASISDKAGNANMTGLDYAAAKIYVDGVDMSGNAAFRAANGMMSLTNVSLTNGEHSISFVVFDNQGNETRVTKSLTVKGSATNAEVFIDGHNEGNHTPKAGSVYYIDVKASDAAQIETVTTTLKLNPANRFEYQHIVCAEGVTATASYDALNFELTVNLTHDGSLSGEAILVSIPVRVWAWSEAKTGISAATQFASKNIPTIDIECETTLGTVKYAGDGFDSYIAGFSGSLDIKTELDNSTAWHGHSAEALEDKAASCVHSGYTGRTYCSDCASVVNWGTIIPVSEHNYEVGEDNILDCSGCALPFTGIHTDGKEYVDGILVAEGWHGETYYVDGVKLTGVQQVPAADGSGEFYYDFGEDGICANQTKFTGVFLDEEAGVYRYAMVGTLASGWHMIDDEWYLFDAATMAAVVGTYHHTDDIVYEFAENGRITKGFWAKTLYGTRYYYGPGAYRIGWQTIEGKEYYFEDYFRLENGYQLIFDDSKKGQWFYFEEDGSCDRDREIPDGFYTDRKGYGYSKNGEPVFNIQMIDGVRYGFNYLGYAKTGNYGGYLFGEDYKGYTGIVEKNGNRYYYENGSGVMAGLVEIEGDYYFAKDGNGLLVTDQTYYVWKGNGIVPESERAFGADGKLLNGIVERDGNYYYYNMGRPEMAGLIEIDGEYYFAKDGNGMLITDQTYYVWKGNGIIPESERTFGPDGKMYNGIVEIDGGYYYYNMGRPEMAGLIEIDGDYYFAKDGKGTIVTNRVYYNWKSNGLLPEGDYNFGADGKMTDGIVEVDGSLRYYVDGKPRMAGLFEFNGDYYFAKDANGTIITDRTYYVWKGNGIVPESERTFGADGKMLDGIVERDGKYYYYNMGRPEMAGLIEIDGDYYFAKDGNGLLITNQTYYVWKGNGIIPESDRTFGADGKMLDGIVERDGKYYYYNMGRAQMAGLIEIDGDYYFAKDGNGLLVTDQTYYVWKGNGLLPESERTFGADGKMLDGFVTKADGIYYYEDGRQGAVGLHYIDGHYYFVGSDGKLVVNRTYYVWKTNGYCVAGNYTFDAQGRIVL